MAAGQKCILAREVDVSKNQINCAALRLLLCCFKDQRIVIGSLKLYHNRLARAGAEMLAIWIRTAPWALYELHLSHNRIDNQGALAILEAIAKTARYPTDRPRGEVLVPLWLRMEHNDIESSFFKERRRSSGRTGPAMWGPTSVSRSL